MRKIKNKKKNHGRISILAGAERVNQAILLAKENGIQDVIAAKEQKAKKIPHRYNSNHKDGATRYESADGKCNFAIIKRDGKYRVYDYIRSELIEFSDVKKLNAFLAALNKGMAENERASVVAESETNSANVEENAISAESTQENTAETKKAAESASAESAGEKSNSKNKKINRANSNEERLSLIGRTEDGRGIYRSNYPKNTPKDVKQKDIINLVQNVWSKKPIKLNLVVDGRTLPIEARFNPELAERSDLSKIVFGNRKGTNSEKRITLDLSSDLYQIAEESHHVRSKTETGKDNPAHIGVSEWHYFLTNLVFVEDDGTKVDCYMNIDVKQNDSGHWFYSFAIEKGTAPRTLLAGVTENSATVPNNSIPETEQKINPSEKNSSENLGEINRKVFKIAKEKVVGYEKLDANSRRAVRGVMRQAIANGFTEDVAADIGSVAARSGAKVTFSVDDCLREKEDGTEYYVNGFYSRLTDTITLNPNASKNVDVLLLHELLHDMFANSGKKGKKAYDKLRKLALSKMPEAERKKIEDRYREHGYNSSEAIEEEITAHYGEEFTNRAFLKALVSEDASIMERIIDFFTKAKDDYAGSEKLSRSAKKFLKTYKKMFDEFSAYNRNNIGYGDVVKYKIADEEEQGSDINEERDALPGEQLYSYDTLTKKRDISVVTLSTEIPTTEDGNIDKNAVIARGRINAKKQNNPNNTKTNTYVRVDDIGLDVLLSKNGMTHGIARSLETAAAVMRIGDVLKNSIVVNELNGSTERKTDMSYVLLGACQDNNNLYVVRSVVSKLLNDVTEIDVYQLGAIKGKKTKTPTSALGGTAVTEQSSLISSESSTISIADFMQYVKDIPLANEVFSENVAKKLGIQRTKGSLSDSLRYSLPDEDVESPTLSNVNKERERYKASPKDKVFTWADNAYISAVDEAFGIHKYIVKCGGVPKPKSSALIQRVRAARAKAETMISSFQYDVITGEELGKGLREIYKSLKDEGYKGKFEDYLLHLLNIDRMTLNERTLAELEKMKAEQDELSEQIAEAKRQVEFFKSHNLKEKAKAEKKKLEELQAKSKELKAKIKNFKVLENKPVFGENEERTAAITAEESRKIVEAYEKKNPEFIKIRDELYAFLNNLQDMRVKAGLISMETKNRLAELYPHYVPSMRDTSYGAGSATFGGKNNISVSSTIKKAKGGGQDILSIEESISAQVFEAVEGIEVNRLARAIHDAAVKSGDKAYVTIIRVKTSEKMK